MIVGDRVEETKEVIVHEFTMGDVEDPDLYAAQPLHEWQTSDIGKWVMEHAVETPCWHRMADLTSYGYKYSITAKLQGARLTEWLLRKGK
jgi:predicted phosphoadenosine phosphosulfate sulfurtransferase